MKKLLVLALVMGIASLATAGLSISDDGEINPGDTFVISFSVAEEVAGVSIRNITDSASGAGDTGGLITAETIHENLSVGTKTMEGIDADRSSAVLQATDGSDGLGGAFNFLGGSKVPASATVFTITVDVSATAAAGTYTINFVEGSYKVTTTPIALGSIDYTIVPEPATMALLGLGALVLRRKK